MADQWLQLIFSVGNLLILPFWLIHIIAPYSKLSLVLAAGKWGALIPAILYGVIILPQVPTLLPIIASPELTVISQLLGESLGATAGWLHFLAFDLYVFGDMLTKANNDGLNPWIMRALAYLTLMFGPLGFICYMIWLQYRKFSR